MSEYENAKCGTCRHWHWDGQQSPIIGTPKVGECLESPPMYVLSPSPTGQVGLQLMFPRLAEIQKACSKHAAKAVVLV